VPRAPAVTIGGEAVPRGERRVIQLPVAALYNSGAPLRLPVHVVAGRRPGPVLFVSAAIHGDELNGVEIIRRLLRQRALARLRGTLIAIPIVNVFGIVQHSRYLPDRRDLNRSFPGSLAGSLASRLAALFLEEIVANATHGIDLHTGALHRSNLPQIRGNMKEPETLRLARAFGVPVLLSGDVRDGSLRQAAAEMGVPVLVYEAGEALRFDELSIRAGVNGVVRVMRALEMLPSRTPRRPFEPVVASSSFWLRAPASGVFRAYVRLGDEVHRDQQLGDVVDPTDFLEPDVSPIATPRPGIVIGCTNLPLVNEGDALFHVARFDDAVEVAGLVEELDSFQEAFSDRPDEPPQDT
jgi:predicted deacylase